MMDRTEARGKTGDLLKPGCNSQMTGTGKVYQKERNLLSEPKLHHPLSSWCLPVYTCAAYPGVQHRVSEEHLLASVTWIPIPSPSIVNTEPVTRRPRLISPFELTTPCVCAKSFQSCPIQWDPMDYSPPGFSVHGILQVRTLQWVAMPSSRGSSWTRDRTCISHVSFIGRQVLYYQCHLGSPTAP